MNAAVIHLRGLNSYSSSQCGLYTGYWLGAARLTDDVTAVTCGSCKKTRAYKKATS